METIVMENIKPNGIFNNNRDEQSVDFTKNKRFRATGQLVNTRSDNHRLTPEPPLMDVWLRKPPDFRPQVYAPKPPKRNSREAMKPWRYAEGPVTQADVTRKRTAKYKLPLIECSQNNNEESRLFLTRFTVQGPYEANIQKVGNSVKDVQPFENPVQYDHRGLQPISKWGLPEFDTKEEKDPFDLKFKRARLHGLQTIPLRVVTGVQIGQQPLKHPPKWQKCLQLIPDTYPNRRKEFSRFRERCRCPKDTLLNRIERVLSDKWCSEGGSEAISWKY